MENWMDNERRHTVGQGKHKLLKLFGKGFGYGGTKYLKHLTLDPATLHPTIEPISTCA